MEREQNLGLSLQKRKNVKAGLKRIKLEEKDKTKEKGKAVVSKIWGAKGGKTIILSKRLRGESSKSTFCEKQCSKNIYFMN